MNTRNTFLGFLSKSILWLLPILSVVQTSCYLRHPTGSSPIKSQMDIDIPNDQISAPEIRRLTVGLRELFQEGIQSLPLATIIDTMQLEGPVTEVIPGILAAHPNPVTVECKGNLCRGYSEGSAHSFVANFVNIPLFGVPTIFISPRIEVELRLSEDGNNIEVCKIIGIRAKASGLGGNLDGFIAELKEDTILTLKTDIGYGGTYPNSSCRPK